MSFIITLWWCIPSFFPSFLPSCLFSFFLFFLSHSYRKLTLFIYRLSLVIIAVILGITNGVAFSRADKFGHASSLAGSALNSGFGNNIAGGFFSKIFFRS